MTLKTEKNMTRLAMAAFWIVLAAVAWGELSPGGIGFNVWDKLQHFAAYALLAGLITVALEARKWWLWGLLGLIAYGGCLEILQSLVGRDMSVGDEMANTLGVIAGGSVGWAFWALLRAWVVEVPAAD
ncbi:MAG TPA: VanZ family protein [Rhizomicrobium sp.]|nr:VanZ family protein [Rhizomicrobium sp.]